MREILYGRQPVREALRAGRRQVFRLLLAQGVKPTAIVGEVLNLAERASVPVRAVERQELDKVGGEVNHQGLAAEVSTYPYADLEALPDAAGRAEEAPFLLLLDHVQDPQNLGSLLRSAEAVGVHGVVIPHRRAAGVTPAVVRASAGAAEQLSVAQVTNLVQTMKALKERDVWIAGLEDDPHAELLWQARLDGPLALVVGSEGAGMRRLVKETCDLKIRLPMVGKINSLNAAVAGSIALYEIAHQRE